MLYGNYCCTKWVIHKLNGGVCIFCHQLSFDLVESWLRKNPDVMGLKNKDGESVFRDLALFQDYHGMPAFKNVYIPIILTKKTPTFELQTDLIHTYMYNMVASFA